MLATGTTASASRSNDQSPIKPQNGSRRTYARRLPTSLATGNRIAQEVLARTWWSSPPGDAT
jgi:hypothetical protein